MASPKIYSYQDLLKVGSPEQKRWNSFSEEVMSGSNFGDAEVQRALDAGYSIDDINEYLKYTNIKPIGNFAVAGQNTVQYGNSQFIKGQMAGNARYEKVPYYRYIGNAQARPKETSSSSSSTTSEAPAPAPQNAPGNPELSIPGVDIRLVSESIGIKPKNSSARKNGLVSKGTSRLTIPRSSGSSSINLGL